MWRGSPATDGAGWARSSAATTGKGRTAWATGGGGAEAAARQGGEPGGAGGVQKKLAAEVSERRERDPGRVVEVWAFDEHRLGLKPVLRRQWAPRGQRPGAVGHPRYEWLYLYGFVPPATRG